MDFVEICIVYIGKMTIKAAKRIFNSDKICRSYSDLNFGVTFLEHSVFYRFSVCLLYQFDLICMLLIVFCHVCLVNKDFPKYS